MRQRDTLATVGYVVPNSAAAGPPQTSILPAFSAGQRLGLAALTVLASVGVFTLLVRLPSDGHMAGLPLAVVAFAPLAARGRRWPLPVLGLVTAASAAQLAAGGASLAVSLMVGVAGYKVAAGIPRPASIRWTVAAGGGLGLALAFAALTHRSAQLPTAAVVAFLPLAAAWFIGDSVAARRRYVAGLAEQAERERAAEAERARQEVREERVRMARELHDVVAHTLAVITVQAGVGRRLMARRPEEARTALESIETIGRTAQDELGAVLGLLRDEHAGAAARTPAPRLADLAELAETVRISGTPVELRTSGVDHQLPAALELTLYRVVQESLTNVVRHAPGACATVDLAVLPVTVRLEVTNDAGLSGHAAGDPPRPAIPGSGHGLVGMRERIGAFGGWLVSEPVPGGGFRVLAEVPTKRSG